MKLFWVTIRVQIVLKRARMFFAFVALVILVSYVVVVQWVVIRVVWHGGRDDLRRWLLRIPSAVVLAAFIDLALVLVACSLVQGCVIGLCGREFPWLR